MEYQNAGVNHPSHYRHRSGLDAIVWIDRFEMDFSVGSCFKYLFRAGLKDGESMDKDHEKALWYFRHAAEKLVDLSRIPGQDQWEIAKERVANQLFKAFGPPGTKRLENGDIVQDWSIGGCDMPNVIEFIRDKCMAL